MPIRKVFHYATKWECTPTHTISRVPDRKANTLSKHRLAVGDIVFSRRGDLRKIAVVSGAEEGFLCGTGCLRARPRQAVNSDYLRYCLLTNRVLVWLEKHAVGQTMLNLNTEIISSLPLFLPDRVEQDKVASILVTWDQAINLTEKLIAEKQQLRKGLMQQLLTGKRRLPGFGKPANQDNLPEGWCFPKTEQVFHSISKKNFPGEVVLSVTQSEGIMPRNTLDRKINMNQTNTHTYKLVEPGDFVISLRSFQGGLEYSRYRGLVSPAYHVIRPTRAISDDFYQHYFKSPEFIQRLVTATVGIRDGKQINYGDFSFMTLPFPPVEEQEAVANTINLADQELKLLQSKADALREQKKGLMQQLLTGKIRVTRETDTP